MLNLIRALLIAAHASLMFTPEGHAAAVQTQQRANVICAEEHVCRATFAAIPPNRRASIQFASCSLTLFSAPTFEFGRIVLGTNNALRSINEPLPLDARSFGNRFVLEIRGPVLLAVGAGSTPQIALEYSADSPPQGACTIAYYIELLQDQGGNR